MKIRCLKKSARRATAQARHPLPPVSPAPDEQDADHATPLVSAAVVGERIDAVKSDRLPRRVVTPSGHRATGLFPSLKCKRARFESLVEEDALRLLEVARSVRAMQTHPCVLELSDPKTGASFHYTPDVFVERADTAMLVEVKGDYWLTQPAASSTLKRNIRSLRSCGIPFMLLLESEVRADGLQPRLRDLLRERPAGGRFGDDIDPARWDPRGLSQPSGDLLRRWREAQKICDALLDRVMRRDPDEVISSTTV